MSLFGLIIALLITPWLVTSVKHRIEKQSIGWKPHQLFPSVIRCYLWTLVVLGIATKISYLEEKHWVAKDRLGARSGLSHTKFEAILFDTLKEEYDTLIGPRP